MCNFFSFIVRRATSQSPVEYIQRWWTDSHSEIAFAAGIDDKLRADAFAKCEFTPGDNWLDPTTWTLRVDEPTTPDWFTDEEQAKARKWAEAFCRARILIAGEHRALMDGWYIIGGTANVVRVGAGARILCVRDSATVSDVRDSATVRGVWGYATVSDVWGSATVSDVWGYATVSGVWGSATVSDVWGYATVSDVRDSATVSDVGPNVNIDDSAWSRLKERQS